jgi:hypothetical protein
MSSLTCDKGIFFFNKKFNHKGYIIIGCDENKKLIEQQQYSCTTTTTTTSIKAGRRVK